MRFRSSLAIGVALTALPLFGFGCTQPSEPAQPVAPQPSVEQAIEQTATSTPDTVTATITTATTPVATKPTIPTAPKAPPKPAAKTVVVNITGMKFSPQVIAVSAGDTIMWVNKDTLPHTTKSDGVLLWDSGTIRPGGSYKHVFKAPGTYAYSCAIHPSMHGTVIVR